MGKDFSVLAGNDGNILACLQAGGAGGVAGRANLWPRTIVSIYPSWLAAAKLGVMTERASAPSCWARRLRYTVSRVEMPGGAGGVAGRANLWPRTIVSIYHHFVAGELEKAREAPDAILAPRWRRPPPRWGRSGRTDRHGPGP